MKSIFTIVCLFIVTTHCIAQAPQAFNYSAVVRNGSGTPIPNQLVKFRLSILRGTITGPSVYVETHSTTTDGNGMVNLEIGRGTIVSGVFAAIPWNNDAFFFQVEVDPTGGNTFQLMGTTQFLSVPYALNAKYAENVAAQFGLFNQNDTVSTFKNNRRPGSTSTSSIPQTIKFFGGGLEDFTFNTLTPPPGITISPLSKSFTANQLKNSSQFSVTQNLNISSSIANGFYTIDNNITTASNRLTNNNYVLHVYDDCFFDSQIPNGLRDSARIGVDESFGIVCRYAAYETTTTTIINTNSSDCNFQIKLDRYNIILNCSIQQDTFLITGSGVIGPINSSFGFGAVVNSYSFNGGIGYFNVYDYPFRTVGIGIKLNAVINFTTPTPCTGGTSIINFSGTLYSSGGGNSIVFRW